MAEFKKFNKHFFKKTQILYDEHLNYYHQKFSNEWPVWFRKFLLICELLNVDHNVYDSFVIILDCKHCYSSSN